MPLWQGQKKRSFCGSHRTWHPRWGHVLDRATKSSAVPSRPCRAMLMVSPDGPSYRTESPTPISSTRSTNCQESSAGRAG